MQDGIGRSAHRDIQAHRVFKRFEAGDVAGQGGFIIIVVIAFAKLDDQVAGALEQLFAVGVGRQHGTVAG